MLGYRRWLCQANLRILQRILRIPIPAPRSPLDAGLRRLSPSFPAHRQKGEKVHLQASDRSLHGGQEAAADRAPPLRNRATSPRYNFLCFCHI